MNTENNELSLLALANVEALAGSEDGGSTSIPCIKYSGYTCSFSCTLADGTTGNCSFASMKKP